MTVSLKCSFKCENYNTLCRAEGSFKFSECDVEFLLSDLKKINFKADRLIFTKVFNVKNQVLRSFKNGALYKSKELIYHSASAEQVSNYINDLFSGTNVNIKFEKSKLTFQGVMSIENKERVQYEIEADKTLLFCLGLLELKDLKGI